MHFSLARTHHDSITQTNVWNSFQPQQVPPVPHARSSQYSPPSTERKLLSDSTLREPCWFFPFLSLPGFSPTLFNIYFIEM